MNRVITFAILLAMLVAVAGYATGAMAAEDSIDPGYVMRFADIGAGQIVFTYEGDLWLVPASGGSARRITNHPGTEMAAKFSPDGRQLAFTAGYDGGNDVYVMDVQGGIPKRLTFHGAGDLVLDWCPDGTGVMFRSNREYPSRASEAYRVNLTGGMPMRLPLDRVALASVAPDRSAVAYNRISRESRTWKRYEGGMAQDIWVKNFKSGEIKKITDWNGTDSFPMWAEGTIYFLSDREDGTLNIYGYDTGTRVTTRLTRFSEYDAKYPSYGDGKIVFQYGSGLSVLDVKTGAVRAIPVTIPTDRVAMRTELVTPNPSTGSFNLSPAGERVLLEARGEILNLPAEEGDPVNLTRTSGSREKYGVWSPDGKYVAFVSDKTGEEQLYLVDQLGETPWRQITDGNFGFTMQPVFSPDSKFIMFADKFMRLHLVDAKAGKATVIAASDYDDAWERWGIQDYVFSPDSAWIAYSSNGANMNESIFLYNIKDKSTHHVTDEMTTDWSPSFSPDGKMLYFLSNRTFNPIMGRQDQNHIFLNLAKPYMVLLQDGQRSPFYQDNVTISSADEEDKKEEADKGTVIDLEGLSNRILACEGVEAGNYFRLEGTDDGFLVLLKNDPEFLKYQTVNDGTGGSLDLLHYVLDDGEIETLMTGIANYHPSPDGKTMIYRGGRRGTTYGVVKTGKEAKVGDGEVDTGALKIRIDRAAEYKQIFAEAWRVQRDWFYDKNMHGVDWQGIYDKYAPFVAGCGSRGDLNYLIGEMIGELNIGHTYIYGGDYGPRGEGVATGLLGASFVPVKDSDYYQITGIVSGVSWDPDFRSPLQEPGVGISEGDFLIAIDGVEVKMGDNVYAHLQDKAGQMVTLKTNSKPQAKGATAVRVRTLRNERGLRYRAWVDGNLDYVTEKSGGQIGYIHLPDMMDSGLIEFGRSYYPQTGKAAMIIDERYNGGGFVGDMIIDRLERDLWAVTIPREGKGGRNPERVHHGPVVVLINEDTGSNGEFFAEAIKRKGLAKVIGVRTWGGSIGIEPHQTLLDGATTTPPQFGLYALDSTWPIEGWGVEPDILVMNMPADVVAGKDAQLDAAIAYLEKVLAENGGKWDIPGTPAYPDKSKPGMSRNR